MAILEATSTAAFVTGHVAGSHAAEIAEYTYLPIEEV